MALAPYPWLEAPARELARMRDRMPNAILIYGAPGTGLYELGLAFSKAVFCSDPRPDGSPCGHCRGCQLTQAGTHPDFKQVLSEFMCEQHNVPYTAAENDRGERKKLSRSILIHQIRVLEDFLALNANQGGRRIILVYPADKVRAEAAASLLKSMEEPPEGLTWVLVAEKLDDVLPTIRSRSRLVRAPQPDEEEALAFLRANRVKNAEAELAFAGGAPLAALEASDDERLQKKTEDAVLELLRSGPDITPNAILMAQPRDLTVPAFSLLLVRWSHDLMRTTLGLGPRYLVNEAENLGRLAKRTTPKLAAGFDDYARSVRRAADHPLNARQVWEQVFLKYMAVFR
ncbi:DNA polymerase III subunit delta [Sutterella sp.]|uniref:DNA polymerase III subunit delta n=1 Tax=Sutterella sp. TaxID=1981025 RepID=UPI0026E077FB|nr:DNA polymerase III subunit delta [Sutterella sp.]MDO5532695.1 DNA polymerase III subunit delta [Sutterella sp.]